MIRLDYRDARPSYGQVRDGLRSLRVTGALAAGEKLPSVRSLATELAINPNTIQRAYSQLETEGYVYTVSGRGTFVCEVREQNRQRRAEVTARVQPLMEELRDLGITREEWTDLWKGGTAMLEAKNVVKTFDGFRALDGVSMTVPQGAVYGLVGPNGAGKSTIIRHFTGIYRPDSGEITLDGQPIYENPAVKGRMAAIPDDWYFFPQASIREMARLYAGTHPFFSWDRYHKLREVFPLSEKQPLRRMSKGMQKQAAFWLTMSCMPEVLVLDEPVDGLDPVMRRQVWSLLLGDVADRGTTVLVSSHNLRELEDVCDHVGILNKGKVLLERSLSDLQDNTVKIQAAYAAAEEPALPPELEVLHRSAVGRVYTYIIRGKREDILHRMQALSPLLLEAIPLTLEEIFIYELGGADYAVREIIL